MQSSSLSGNQRVRTAAPLSTAAIGGLAAFGHPSSFQINGVSVELSDLERRKAQQNSKSKARPRPQKQITKPAKTTSHPLALATAETSDSGASSKRPLDQRPGPSLASATAPSVVPRPEALECTTFMACDPHHPREDATVAICGGHDCDMRVCNLCMDHLARTVVGLARFCAIGPHFRLCGGCARLACAADAGGGGGGSEDDEGDDDDDNPMKPVMPARQSAGGRR
jgi:hypothetical protein